MTHHHGRHAGSFCQVCMTILSANGMKRAIRQDCKCGGREATQALEYRNGMLVADKSWCVACGTTLWDWTSNTPSQVIEVAAIVQPAWLFIANKRRGQMSLW